MALILNIETATQVCSVALSRDGKELVSREDHSGQSHARLLTTFISDCLQESGYQLHDLDALAVSKGPGSFTGLRIGVASVKGICYALDKPLIAVNTLQSMTSNFLMKESLPSGTWLCPMIDARRMEVYTAFFNQETGFERPTSAEVIEPGIFGEILDKHPVVFFGDGMPKIRHIFENHPNATFNSAILPSASGMIRFSEDSYKNGLFEDVAYFEPFYLKDFFTGRQPSKAEPRP